MKRVLLLRGTGDALTIARGLGPDHVYSLAGLGRMPGDLACSVRVGGFGGVEGLKTFLEAESIGLIVDATHPYAAQMSRHASAAGALQSVECWGLRRGPFSLDGDRALFDAQQTDVLVSKNSGGAATEAKLAVARERGLPVVMLQRPRLPPVEREFSDTSSLLTALEAWLHPHPLFDKNP